MLRRAPRSATSRSNAVPTIRFREREDQSVLPFFSFTVRISSMPDRQRSLFRVFLLLLLSYALLAGLHTVGDADLGWQLATGRSLVQTRSVPSQDSFSYTARGREWIYPPFSGALLYGVHRL